MSCGIHSWLKPAGVILLLVLGPVAVYWNALHAPFVLDDRPIISENPSIRTLWPLTTPLSPPGGGLPVSARPAANLSFALSYALSGEAPVGHHAVNVALHVLTALALAGVLRRTLARPALAGHIRTKADQLALAIAALWALHPLQTAAVTYVSQRTELLASFCFVLTLLAFVRAAEASTKRGWGAIAFVACLVGMASKETMAAAPLIALLYDRTFIAGGFAEAWRRHGRLHAALMSTWLLLAWLVWQSDSRGGTAGVAVAVSPAAYLLTQGEAIVGYLLRAVWPRPLVFDYGDYLAPVGARAIACSAVVGSLAIATVAACVRTPSRSRTSDFESPASDQSKDSGPAALGFAGAVFFGVLAPTSSIVPVATQTIADHRMYLPLAAVLTTVVLAIYGWIERSRLKDPVSGQGASHRRPLPFWLIVGAAGVASAAATIERNRDFASAVDLWRDTVQKRPENIRARNNLAASLLEAGQTDAGLAELRAALRIESDHPDVLRNLAQAELNAGRVGDALAHVERAQRLDPRSAAGWTLLGAARLRAGRAADAVGAYRQAVAMRPDSAAAAFGLGVALFQAERNDEAIAVFEQLARRKPGFPGLGLNYGGALLEAGRIDDALRQFDAALAHEPPTPELLYLRAAALLELGRREEGERAVREILKSAPGYAPARELATRLGL